MKMLILFTISVALMCCEPVAKETAIAGSQTTLLEEAHQNLADDEISLAKEKVREILMADPEDEGATTIMAQIIDYEIARFKETEVSKVIEEYTEREKEDAVKTWMERGQALFDAKQYEQAILATEKVFLYEPENLEASHLIDEIRKKARAEGRGEGMILKRMYQTEIRTRIERYMRQARGWIETDRWGAARLALEKVLLLEPEHREALKLYERVKAHNRGNRAK